MGSAMTTDTQRTPTAHGEIEYETVECAFCQQMIVAENAVSVVLGGEVENVYHTLDEIDLCGTDIEASVLCPYCAESIFGFDGGSPSAISTGRLARHRVMATLSDNIWLLVAIFWGLMTLVYAGFFYAQIG